ncbi:MAG TPA: hypothetical protein VGO52_17295 [Hyphomonadaceae bacterium]|jgi:hypothetical protein|nr:hypothetical protein [Hyphomonadaceae bacterium]
MNSQMGHNNPPAQITAEIVRIETKKADIKLIINGSMHLLAWRRESFRDVVTVNGVEQAQSRSLGKRETLYGLVFGKSPEGEGGVRVLFTIDPKPDWTSMNWNGETRLSGVRLEAGEGVLLSYGTLDPRSFKKPESFQEWVKKTMGISD